MAAPQQLPVRLTVEGGGGDLEGSSPPRVSYSPSPLNLNVDRGPESTYYLASIVVIYGSSSLCNISPYSCQLDYHIHNSADNP